MGSTRSYPHLECIGYHDNALACGCKGDHIGDWLPLLMAPSGQEGLDTTEGSDIPQLDLLTSLCIRQPGGGSTSGL